ncbi:hypothetical protein MKZ38_010329 [Zalerion maritima]|uniref:Uncharacterized protein n=1 Tax=Zalerion maritima TaxID=339359 RepID=A0AAD5RZ93_9PEZI|nr:hypothetical protein MKZ38_010329 [Zalerion maritima]
MKFSLMAAALVSGVSAELGGILVCTGPDATGPCYHDTYSLNTCHDLEPSYANNAATFAPDGEPFYCLPKALGCDEICRSPTGCTFGPVDFAYGNKFDLGAIGWDTIIESFWCYKNTSDPEPTDTVDPTPEPTGTDEPTGTTTPTPTNTDGPSCPVEKRKAKRVLV